MARVLITGGSGLIGQHLGKTLKDNGFQVAVLSSQKRIGNDVKFPVYYWDLDKNIIDREALNSSDYIIHLAGANIGEKRWTDQRKLQILESRIKTAELIFNKLDQQNHNLKAFISASAVGYYGALTSDKIFEENDSSADDFLGKTCLQWEQAADKFTDIGVRVVKIRAGIVLSDKGGFLTRYSIPAKLGLAAALGNGKQYMPWIHIKDLGKIYLSAIKNNTMKGVYNAVSPDHITNKELSRKIARSLRRPLWLPNLPSFFIKLMFGEMSEMLLKGSRVSSEKLKSSGYEFSFSTIEEALENLIHK